MNKGIYIASRCRYAPMWRDLREAGHPIISTWIDEAGEGETDDFTNLWERCINEPKTAQAFLLYRENAEPLKGALVELGSALSAGVPVFTVGCEDMKEYSFMHHRLVKYCLSLQGALYEIQGVSGHAEQDAGDDDR